MESKTYVFGENGPGTGGGLNSILAMLPALMQKQGVDPSLFALCNGKSNGNGLGENLFAILLLFILMGRGNFFGGGFGGGIMPNGQGGVVPMLNNDANTAVIMQAVQRNGYDVQSLATALNTSSDAVMAAINSLGQQVCNIGSQMGMNTNQIITALMQGNNAIATQLAECCCKTNNAITAMDGNVKLAMCQQTGALTNAINNVAVGQERGFANVAYETQRQTCDLQNSIKDSTQTIVNGQQQAVMREMQNKIDALREENSTFKSSAMTSQIVGQAIAPINAVLTGLQQEVAGIKCKLPETATVAYSPFTAVPNCVAAQMGLYGFNAVNGASFWT
jgi:hypothetical protein